MKIILLAAFMILVSIESYASTIYLANPEASQITANSTVLHTVTADKYYKCSNTVSVSCNTGAIQVTYTGVSSGSCTSLSPCTLTSCSNIKCACDSSSKYLNSNSCTTCPNNSVAINSEEFGAVAAHVATSCLYCPPSYYKLGTTGGHAACRACPSNGTCDGTETVTCAKGYYSFAEMGYTTCKRCPQYNTDNGATNDAFTNSAMSNAAYGTTATTGATAITGCYVAAGTYYDSTGRFTLTSKCDYK